MTDDAPENDSEFMTPMAEQSFIVYAEDGVTPIIDRPLASDGDWDTHVQVARDIPDLPVRQLEEAEARGLPGRIEIFDGGRQCRFVEDAVEEATAAERITDTRTHVVADQSPRRSLAEQWGDHYHPPHWVGDGQDMTDRLDEAARVILDTRARDAVAAAEEVYPANPTNEEMNARTTEEMTARLDAADEAARALMDMPDIAEGAARQMRMDDLIRTVTNVIVTSGFTMDDVLERIMVRYMTGEDIEDVDPFGVDMMGRLHQHRDRMQVVKDRLTTAPVPTGKRALMV